jgi:hypothetical protein
MRVRKLSRGVQWASVCAIAVAGAVVVASVPGGPAAVFTYDSRGSLSGVSAYDTASDPNNCGVLGNRCTPPVNGYPLCAGGACGFGCATPYAKCGAACKVMASDVANCGSCGNACPAAQNAVPLCTGGACAFACNSGYTKCGSACVNLAADGYNCGGCGVVCGSGKRCQSGICVSSSLPSNCPSGYPYDCCGAAHQGWDHKREAVRGEARWQYHGTLAAKRGASRWGAPVLCGPWHGAARFARAGTEVAPRRLEAEVVEDEHLRLREAAEQV